jgi:hypothetical protein
MMQQAMAQALEVLHTRIAEAVLALDQGALTWQPAPSVESIYEVILRVAADENLWLGSALANISVSGEEPTVMVSTEHPLFRLGSAGQLSQVLLAHLQVADWSAQHVVDGHMVTAAGAVLHCLEELSRALGQIEIIARLWEASGAK